MAGANLIDWIDYKKQSIAAWPSGFGPSLDTLAEILQKNPMSQNPMESERYPVTLLEEG